jgi:hypothetical protein
MMMMQMQAQMNAQMAKAARDERMDRVLMLQAIERMGTGVGGGRAGGGAAASERDGMARALLAEMGEAGEGATQRSKRSGESVDAAELAEFREWRRARIIAAARAEEEGLSRDILGKTPTP